MKYICTGNKHEISKNSEPQQCIIFHEFYSEIFKTMSQSLTTTTSYHTAIGRSHTFSCSAQYRTLPSGSLVSLFHSRNKVKENWIHLLMAANGTH